MWPFNKLGMFSDGGIVDQKPEEKKLLSKYEEQAIELFDFRNAGQMFKYLGRDCVVTNHGWFYKNDNDLMSMRPKLDYEYCDDNGVIRKGFILHSGLEALKEQNK